MGRLASDGMSARGRDRRTPADSLAVVPIDRGRSFHLFSHGGVRLRAEIVDAVYAAGKPPVATAMMLGEVWARVRAAARGRLVDSDRLSPIRSRPDLWELRWSFRRVGEFRMYHAEPGARPALVGLVFHRKDVDGLDDDQVRAAQQSWMDRAAERHRHGADERWGHVPRRCPECLDVGEDV